jgi:hypothetical protein
MLNPSSVDWEQAASATGKQLASQPSPTHVTKVRRSIKLSPFPESLVHLNKEF